MTGSSSALTLPRPRTPGAELAALARFYTDVNWTGTIEPRRHGTGQPGDDRPRARERTPACTTGCGSSATTGRTSSSHDGTFVLTWQLHWVTGWDADAEEYRATLNDNYGHADVMRGRLTVTGLRLRVARRQARPGCG